jgi:hypothetical protein
MHSFKEIDQTTYNGNYRGGASTMFFNCRRLAKEVFGADRMNAPCLTALAYLYRRFGPPFYGSDAYKEICSYFLTTPTPGLFLDVGIKASAAIHLWGCAYTPELEETFPTSIAGRLEAKILVECRESLKASMREMLRPVFVRDNPIHLFGRCEEEDFSDEEFAERSCYAGLGAAERETLDRWLKEDSYATDQSERNFNMDSRRNQLLFLPSS